MTAGCLFLLCTAAAGAGAGKTGGAGGAGGGHGGEGGVGESAPTGGKSYGDVWKPLTWGSGGGASSGGDGGDGGGLVRVSRGELKDKQRDLLKLFIGGMITYVCFM